MADEGPFEVSLNVFSGPFSVLLSLISRRRLDVTDVALAEVTDEFIAFIRSHSVYNLSQASEFLVVAATLLDLKAARLLPDREESEEEFELLEQRDLLFARLLQYRAYKRVSQHFVHAMASQARAYPRDVPLDPEFVGLIPRLQLNVAPEELALLAFQAFSRDQSEPTVSLEHLHHPLVSVASQVDYVRAILQRRGPVTFSQLCGDAINRQTVVSRFMAILELIRRGEIRVEQSDALETLTIAMEETS